MNEKDLEMLNEVLKEGEGFEGTEQGKKLGFNEELIKRHAFNSKCYFIDNLKSLKIAIESEEDLFNKIKESFDENKIKMVEFIEKHKGTSIQKIKTSDIKNALEIFKEGADDVHYDSTHIWVKTFLDVARNKEFDIVGRFSADSKTIVGENRKAQKIMTKDLARYIDENKLDLSEILSIHSQTLEERFINSMNRENNYHYANEAAERNKLEKDLANATKPNFRPELKTYIDAFNFESRNVTYDDFYKMMVHFAIKDNDLGNGRQWDTWEEFKNSKEGELIEHQKINEKEDDYRKNRDYIVRKIGDDHYSVLVETISDAEGKNHVEKWFKNGEIHRDGNKPAKTKISHHYIPSETYLDEATEEYWIDGEMLHYKDITYDAVLSKKSLAERQSIGYDVDDPSDYDEELEEEFPSSKKDYIIKEVEKYKKNRGFDKKNDISSIRNKRKMR